MKNFQGTRVDAPKKKSGENLQLNQRCQLKDLFCLENFTTTNTEHESGLNQENIQQTKKKKLGGDLVPVFSIKSSKIH